MNESLKRLLGGIVLAISLLSPYIPTDILNKIPPLVNNTRIEIKEPSKENKVLVDSFSEVVTREEHKIKLAIYLDKFANKLGSKNNVNGQQVNDFLVEGVKNFVGTEFKGLYPKLLPELLGLIQKTTGTDNKSLTKEEIVQLSDRLSAAAWDLAN